MLLTEFVKHGIAVLEPLYPAKEARSIILMLCEYLLGTKSYTYILEPEYSIDDSHLGQLDSALDRLKEGEPIQYVLGKATFSDFEFKVDSNVLIPRPETEIMCADAIKFASRISRMRSSYGKNAVPVRVLDLCTGSGCISWTIALSVPGSKVIGVDISEKALEVARHQDFSAQIKERNAIVPDFIEADVLDSEQKFPFGMFDIVISNPPYIKESEKKDMRRNVLDYEPSLALFVPDDDPLVFYRSVARWSQRFLEPEGIGFTEVNETLARQTETVFRAAGYMHTEIVKDLSDRNRYIIYHK